MDTAEPKSTRWRIVGLLLAMMPALGHRVAAQDSVRVTPRTVLAGALTVTTKGISTVPSFTLGKPAAILDISIFRRGFSFDPQFKMGLNGKPWAFVFWGRYRLVDRGPLHVAIGGHPALAFRSSPVTIGGVQRDLIVSRRYLAGEFTAAYTLSRYVSVGPYYLYSHAFENDVPRTTQFLSARAYVTRIPLSKTISLRIDPQVYYLRTDDRDGYYAYSGVTLAKAGLPLSISSIVNQPLRTNVVGGDDFLWNVSATYAIR
jgi:hypothetical protein